MASIKDVAKAANVSISTVSLALNYPERVSDPTREKIFSVIKQLRYTPAPVSKNVLSDGVKKKAVALLTSVIFGAYFFEVMRGINETLDASGIEMILISGEDACKRHLFHIVQEKIYNGVILISDEFSEIQDGIIAAGEQHFPLVIINAAEQYKGVGSVSIDNYYSGQMMANHFLHIGYREIALFGTHTQDRAKRAEGFIDTLKANSVTIPDNWNIITEINEKSGIEIANKFLQSNTKLPQAIFCLNDELAMGVIKTFSANGIHVPSQIAVTGCDDLSICKYFSPELTTINVPKFASGVLAASSLLRQINGKSPENIVISGKLVIRESCGYKEKNRRQKRLS